MPSFLLFHLVFFTLFFFDKVLLVFFIKSKTKQSLVFHKVKNTNTKTKNNEKMTKKKVFLEKKKHTHHQEPQ